MIADDTTSGDGIRVTRSADLTSLNTLRLKSHTDLLVEVLHTDALPDALRRFGKPRAVLGAGSNVVLGRSVEGPVFRLLGAGFEAREIDDGTVEVCIEAGMPWDALVDRCIAAGAHGIENLALIPGLAGAAPIQNIGAYGVELAESIASVEAFDLECMTSRVLGASDCGFGYRDSRFKREAGNWLVTRLRLRLARHFDARLGYAGISDELGDGGNAQHSAQQIADAIRRIRRRKLPDPTTCPNAGSFFKNPVVPLADATALRERWPHMPIYPQIDGRAKLSAAWLIESCDLKGSRAGDAAISLQHSLVVVNHGGATHEDVVALESRVRTVVREAFGLTLEREPVLIQDTATA